MFEHSTDDLVLLRFHAAGEETPAELAVPDLADAVGADGEGLSRRVELLSALTSLENEGLVERIGGGDRRNRYRLTDRGRRRAAELYESVADRSIVVRNGDETEVPLAEADRFFDEAPVVTALSRTTDDGVVYLDDGSGGEGFVDREAPVERLVDLFETAATEGAETAFVLGEAGVGKTSLVRELGERVAPDRTLVGSCQPSTDEPYGPFRDLLSAAPGGDPIAAADAPAPDDEEALSAQRRALFRDVTDRLREAAADGPVLCFLDDLQWAGDATVDLFVHVAEHLGEAPVLLVGAYRTEDLPDDHPTAELRDRIDGATAVTLDPLPREDVADLVRWVLDARSVPSSFVDLVYEHIGGNPLFVEEAVRGMLDDGTVDPINDVYPEDRDSIAIPGAVEAAIDRRLSTLPDEATDLLELASVVGTRVPWSLLRSLSDLREDRLREYVEALVESRVWRPAGDGEAYRFVSGAVRDAVYERVYESRRELLHEEVAEAMEAADADGEDRHERIGHHYAKAGDEERALEHYAAAGEAAESVYAHRDAIDRYERAVELARSLGRDAEVLSLLEDVGQAHVRLGEYEAADRRFRYVRDRADDDAVRQRAYRRQANLRLKRDEYEAVIDVAREGIEIDPGSPEACRLLDSKGMAHLRLGDHDGAREAFDRQLELARSLDDRDLLGNALHDLGTLEFSTGNPDDAVGTLERALEIRRDSDDDDKLANTLNNLGIAHRRRGDLDAAADRYETALEVYRDINDEYHVAMALTNLSNVYGQQGDLATAIEYGEDARERSERIGDDVGTAIADANLGKYHRQLGDHERARENLSAALERFESLGHSRYVAKTLVDLGATHRACDDLDSARECHERGVEVATGADLVEAAIENRAALAHDHLAADDPDAASDLIERAREDLDGIDNPEVRVKIELVTGRCRFERGDHGDAVDHLEHALDLATEGAFPEGRASARRLLGTVAADRGDDEDAREHLEAAVEIAGENDLGAIEDAAETLLAEV